MFRPLLFLLLLSLLVWPLSAQAQTRRLPQLSPTQYNELRQVAQGRRSAAQLVELRGVLRRHIPFFRVPAVVSRRMVCTMDPAYRGLVCNEEQGERATCPTEVELRIEGSNATARVPVSCVGPIDGRDCECEFSGD